MVDFRILGQPGRDNALFVEIDTGQAMHRLLFDCGEACLRDLAVAQIQAVDALLFSHFHIDHIAGFDSFLRSNYNRPGGPVQIWGPPGAAEILQHRLRGVTWNLVAGEPGEIRVTEIGPNALTSFGFLTREAFAVAHPLGEQPFDGVFMAEDDFQIEARLMNHGTPSVAYRVREKARTNVNTDVLSELGLRPGAWLKQIKDLAVDPGEEIEAGGTLYRVGDLRDRLLVSTPGESIAYLTDFRLDDSSEGSLLEMLQGCETIVCENNFRNEDQELAQRSFHMISTDVGRLAKRAGAKKLVLFHLSDRYTPAEWQEQLAEVRREFRQAYFPEPWDIAAESRPA